MSTTPDIPFQGFPKMGRWNREVVITEKIDGTNAQVYVNDTGTEVFAGSRNRWITPADDNFGFARWVEANRDELLRLGPGSHFGEWWGSGIQRRYGLNEKRFSLFNVHRWGDDATRPKCCHVVPVLWRGNTEDLVTATEDMASISPFDRVLSELRTNGSAAAPGFMQPEGIVLFHTATGTLFKRTLENDDTPKSAVTR